MELTSVWFLLMVIISMFVYWLVPGKCRWIILLVDSFIFYYFNTTSIYTMGYVLFSVLLVYFAANYISSADNRHKKAVFLIALVIVVGILVVLKYTNLFIGTYNYFSTKDGVHFVRWLTPLAISYYTFSLLSYLIDVYWGVVPPEKNPLKVLLFVMFFPLMVSGPICRYGDVGVQLFEVRQFDYKNAARGMRRIVWGMAKKLVVADRLSYFVNYMFADSVNYKGLWIIVIGLLFAIELYFDFSGCMDIVIGTALCFGIVLEENFKAPFFAKTIQEFWQRWHITLGVWFKNYVMYPVLKTSGFVNIGKKAKTRFGKIGKRIPAYIGMILVWTLIGIWHGSSWKYVIGTGWWFALIIILGQILENRFATIKHFLRINDENIVWQCFQRFRTWIFFSIGMIFFFATDLPGAIEKIKSIFCAFSIIQPLRALYENVWCNHGGKWMLLSAILIAIVQIFIDWRVYHEKDVQCIIENRPFVVRWLLYIVLIAIILLFGVFEKSAFLYWGF